MKNLKGILSIITVLVLSLGVLCFAGCKTEKDTKIPTSGVIDITDISSNGISLTKTSATVVGDHLEQTLTATITGGDSNTKLVWNLDIGEEGILESDLSISPSEDTRSCIVKCYDEFGNFGDFNAVITVYVEDNPEIYATCEITYLGYPTDLIIEDTSDTLNEGGTKFIAVTLKRDLFDMFSAFDEALFNVDIDLKGSVTVLCTYYDENSNAVESKEVTRSSTDPRTFDLTIGSFTSSVSFSRYFNESNYLNFDKSFRYGSSLEIGTYPVNGRFRLIPEDENISRINGVLVDYDLSFTVTVTEPISGLSNSFTFKLEPKPVPALVSNVTLDKTTISF